MKLVTAFIQPHKLPDVKAALLKNDITKMSVSNALGCGQQAGFEETYRGVKHQINLLKKVRLDIAVTEKALKITIDTICAAAKTGKIGDGKIFVTELAECIRIRTNETGDEAIG